MCKEDLQLPSTQAKDGSLQPAVSTATEDSTSLVDLPGYENPVKLPPASKTPLVEAEGLGKPRETTTPAQETTTPPPAKETTTPVSENGAPQEEERKGVEEEERSQSQTTLGGSQDLGPSSDSASFSIPSLELSDITPGNSLDEPLSSSYSALGVEGRSPSADAPCLGEEEAPAGAGPGFTSAPAVPPPATGGATAALEPEPAAPAYYFVKWITWKEKKTPIITQSENGPCPLLAIMNTLFLRWKVRSLALALALATVIRHMISDYC